MRNQIQGGDLLDCGHRAPVNPPGYMGGSGYGCDANGHTFCYPCAAELDADTLRNCDRWDGYLLKRDDGYHAGNWPGSFDLPCWRVSFARPGAGGFGAQRTDIWFNFEGRTWHGINRGDNDILRCRVRKEATK